MYRLFLSWRSLVKRPLQTGLTVAVTAVATALAVMTLLLGSGIYGAFIRATEPFQLVVGAKGSAYQLLLNSVFLQDQPLGNFPLTEFTKLKQDPLVANAYLLGFGDNHLGYRVVGVTRDIFTYRLHGKSAPWLRVKNGNVFAQRFEAVVGAAVASATGLKPGDRFHTSHGVVSVGDSAKHQDEFTVSGVMEELGEPYDMAILVAIEDIWAEHEHGHQHDEHGDEHEVTAALVEPAGYSQAMQLALHYQNDRDLQMIFPAQQIIRLFSLFLGGEQILRGAAISVFLIALIVIGISMYWSASSRAKERAILRALGAGKRDLLLILTGEGFLLVAAGTVCGALLGHLAFALLTGLLRSKTALGMAVGVTSFELGMLALIMLLEMTVTLLPALSATRRDAVRDL